VEQCPAETYTPLGAAKLGSETPNRIKARMRPYCTVVSDAEFDRLSVQELVTSKICPPW
jgi:hypothetical protein